MQRKDHIDLFGAVILIGFSVLLGLNQALVKLVNDGLAPIMQAGLRSLAAFVPILLFAVIMRRKLQFERATLGLGVLNGLIFGLEFCLLFIALDYSTVARVSLFFYTMPVWVALGAHLLIPTERLTSLQTLGLMIALVGVAVGLFQGQAAALETAWLGDSLSLLAAMLWAATVLLLRTTRLAQLSAEMNLLYQLAISGVLLTAFAYAPFDAFKEVFGEPIREPTPILWAIFAFQVISVACVGFLTWIWLLSIYPATKMTSFSLLTPIAGVAFGWLIFNDELTPLFILALLLVGAGLLLVNRQESH